MELHRPWDPCTKGMTVEQHLAQLRFPLTRSYYRARLTQLASCGIPQTEIASNSQLQALMHMKAMLDISTTIWNVSDHRHATLLPPLPDDTAVFSAIHLASMSQTEGCMAASSLNRDLRLSIYESTWQDMLFSFVEDRSACCVEDSCTVASNQAEVSQRHVSCIGKLVWGEYARSTTC